jgi:hypothetical protein
MKRRRWARLILALSLLCGALVVGSAPAQAADNPCGQTWPTTGTVTTYHDSTNYYSVTFRFTLTAGQLSSLRCTGAYLELDFRIRNFNVPSVYPFGWDGYTVAGSNLPGVLHDVAFEDSPSEPNPAVTRIYTSQLQAGVSYYANLTWNADANSGTTPYVFFVWEPSRWANMSDPRESSSCSGASFGNNQYPAGDSRNPNEAWCIFPVSGMDVTLLGDKTFAGGFPAGQIPLTSGQYWYTFSPSTPATGSGVGNSTFDGRNFLRSSDAPTLLPGHYILSSDARFVFILQPDGNLVLYGPGYIPLWATNTSGLSVDHLSMQGDGNLVLYGPGGVVRWQSNTNGGASHLTVQDDGNAVVYTDPGAVVSWQSFSIYGAGITSVGSDHRGSNEYLYSNMYIQSPDKRYDLIMQPDGNLVLNGPGGHAIWNAGTSGAGNYMVMQPDGNLVVYNSAGTAALWYTTGHGGSLAPGGYVRVQNDGNLVVYTTSGAAAWNAGTAGLI